MNRTSKDVWSVHWPAWTRERRRRRAADTINQTATWQVRGIVHIVGRVLGRLIEAAAYAGVIDD
jgi:hypothetical protein